MKNTCELCSNNGRFLVFMVMLCKWVIRGRDSDWERQRLAGRWRKLAAERNKSISNVIRLAVQAGKMPALPVAVALFVQAGKMPAFPVAVALFGVKRKKINKKQNSA